MKRVMMMLLVIAVSINTVMANDEERVSRAARNTFTKEFPGAQYAKWEAVIETEMYMVRFAYKEQSVVAYVGEDGVLLATVRLVSKDHLPFTVSETIARKYTGYTVVKAEELTMTGELSYMLVLTDENCSMIVRIFNNGNTNVIRKEKL